MNEQESKPPQVQPSATSDLFTGEQLRTIQEAQERAALEAKPENDTNAEIEAMMARVRVNHAKLDPRDDAAGPTLKSVTDELERFGYPARARETLPRMEGPGLEKAQKLLPVVLSGDCILILHGDRGPGKTQMATFWAAQRGLQGNSVGRYIKTFDLLAKIKATWQSKNGKTEAETLRVFEKTKFLVLDEFQERSESEWDNRTLTNILDHRYDARLSTILICNLTRSEVLERIPASILSRAEEVGGLIHCDWPSYRSNPEKC